MRQHTPPTIQHVFTDVAPVYDTMNDWMSLGFHRTWKDLFVQQLPWDTLKTKKDLHILDMATGTGDIPDRLERYLRCHHIHAAMTVCDRNEDMLAKGRQKHPGKPWTWRLENATALSFKDESFDLYTVSFGLRNMPPLNKTLKEAFRVLKKGGFYYVLEFSHPPSACLHGFYALYTHLWLPALGAFYAKKPHAYDYLIQSIKSFPKAPLLEGMMKHVGFHNTGFTLVWGGIVAIHWGQKVDC